MLRIGRAIFENRGEKTEPAILEMKRNNIVGEPNEIAIYGIVTRALFHRDIFTGTKEPASTCALCR